MEGPPKRVVARKRLGVGLESAALIPLDMYIFALATPWELACKCSLHPYLQEHKQPFTGSPPPLSASAYISAAARGGGRPFAIKEQAQAQA